MTREEELQQEIDDLEVEVCGLLRDKAGLEARVDFYADILSAFSKIIAMLDGE
jgi:hypothetical protein